MSTNTTNGSFTPIDPQPHKLSTKLRVLHYPHVSKWVLSHVPHPCRTLRLLANWRPATSLRPPKVVTKRSRYADPLQPSNFLSKKLHLGHAHILSRHHPMSAATKKSHLLVSRLMGTSAAYKCLYAFIAWSQAKQLYKTSEQIKTDMTQLSCSQENESKNMQYYFLNHQNKQNLI